MPRDERPLVPAFSDPDKTAGLQRYGQTIEQNTQSGQAAAALANTRENDQAIRQQGAQRIGIEAGRLGVEKQRLGFDQNGGVSPAAQMAVDGRMDPQTLRRLLRSQPGLLGQIKKLDPQFDEANLENRYNTLKEFTNTSPAKAGGQLLALNTLIHHGDLYMETAKAIANNKLAILV